MRVSAAPVWQVVHTERRQLVTDLSDLTEEQWRTPSLCPEWDVHDVLAHLVDTAWTTRFTFIRDMVAARADFDRANALGVAREKRPNPRETLAAFREAQDLTRTPPASLATRLVEAIVHGEDIRRPLCVRRTYPSAAIAQALSYQLRTPVRFGGGRERASGLRLTDNETGATWGSGCEVRGAALDLLLAVSGRQIEPPRLTGAGAQQLLESVV